MSELRHVPSDDPEIAPAPTPAAVRVPVWDLPTRLVHWLFVLLVSGSWWTAETGRLEWHRWSGYLLLGIVLFRVYWGFAGGSTARFSNFVRGPRTIASYLRGTWAAAAGHNPLGALSVLLLLALLLLQIGLGLFAVDVDGIESGPLSAWVSFQAGRAAAEWHELVFNVLVTVILLHVLAALYYLFVKRQNLIGGMVTGERAFAARVDPVEHASIGRLVIGIVLSTALTWAISQGFQFT
jgi:cytochrome b